MSALESAPFSSDALDLAASEQRQKSIPTIYAPLGRNEIRLLEILPRNLDEQLKCKLSVHSLDDKPSYTALSYVWGDPQWTRPIVVQGHHVPATVNLVDALLQMREQGIHLLWADALCINQHDDTEKAQQIQMMTMIYREATDVVAWLGHSDTNTERTLQNITKVTELARSLGLKSLKNPNLWEWTHQELIEAGVTIIKALCSDSEFKKGDIGLIISFQQRPYWTRLWVVQELCLASSAKLSCGSHMIQWEILEIALMALVSVIYTESRVDHQTELAFNELCHPYEAGRKSWEGMAAAQISARLRAENGSTMSMWDLLECTCNNSNLEASNPRDRIYALHGLLPEDDRKAVTVDFSISCTALYAEATIHLLRQYGPIIFEFCGPDLQTGVVPLPSWAVDWTCTQSRVELSNSGGKLATPFDVQDILLDRIILNAAEVGHIIAVVPFSGKRKDLLNVIDRIEQASQLHVVEDILLDRRNCAWQAVLYNSYDLSTTRAIDVHLRCCLQNEAACTNNTTTYSDRIEAGGATKTDQDFDKPSKKEQNAFFERVLSVLRPQTLFVTDRGHIGKTRPHVQVQTGDTVFAFPEYGYPFVFRNQVAEGETWIRSLVGRAFVDELMGFGFVGDERAWCLTEFWRKEPTIENIVLC